MALSEKVRIVVDVVAGNAKKELNDIKTAVANTDGAFGKMRTAGGGAFKALEQNAGNFAMAAGAAIAAYGVKAVGAFQDLALQAGKFADATGVSVEDASRLIEAFGDIGVEASTVQGALNKMNLALGKNSAEIETLGLKGATTTETFLNIIGYLNGIKDPAERARQGTKLLGKSWAEMSEAVAMGADGLAESLASVSDAKVIDKGELASARAFRDALDEMSGYAEDFTLVVGGELVPVITKWIGGLQKIKELVDIMPDLPEPPSGWFDLVAGLPGISSLAQPINAAGDAMTYLSGSSEEMEWATEDASVAAEKAATALEEERAALELAAEEAALLEDATRSLIDATLASASATLGAADAYDNAIEAIETATVAVDDGKTTIDEKAAADRKAEEAALKYAAAEAKAAEETAKANGEQFTAKQAADVQIKALERVKEQFPTMGPAIDVFIGKMQTASNPVTAKVTVEADLEAVDRAIRGMQSRANAVGVNVPISLGGGSSGSAGGGAWQSGGNVTQSGPQLVGEAGPELVNLPQGTHVYNNADTNRMMGARIYNITVNVAASAQPADVGRELVSAIGAYERANGTGWRQH